MTQLVDAWTHIFPPAYFSRLQELATASGPLKRWMNLRSLYDLDVRFKHMDLFEGYSQVLTPSMPPVEELGEADEAHALSQLMNDGLAQLVQDHPQRFAGWAGAISLLDPRRALKEIERAAANGARGFQLPTHVRGGALDNSAYREVFDAIGELNLAIWLHPVRGPAPDYPTEDKSRHEIWWCFGWPYESSVAMARLVFSGLFDRIPHLRIVTHHMGAMIPFFAGRIEQGWGLEMGSRTPPADSHLLPGPLARPVSEYFRMFYADTALSGHTPGLRCGLDFFPGSHVLFASDYPFDAEGGTYLIRETLRSIEDLRLPPNEQQAICQNNLRSFLAP